MIYLELIEEIMQLPIEKEVSLLNTIRILNRCGNVQLLNNESFDLYYICDIKSLMESGITPEELIMIRNGGWSLTEDKKSLIKYI